MTESGMDNNIVHWYSLEEKLSKKKAVWLFESGTLDTLHAGTFAALQAIHKYLFEDIYNFAGKLRTVSTWQRATFALPR